MSRISKKQFREIVELYGIKTTEDAHDAVKDIMGGVLQAAIDAELELTLGYAKHDYENKRTDNSRNGSYPKKAESTFGDIDLNRTPLKAKSLMGYLPENPLIYDKLTGAETLELIGKLRKLSNEMIEQRVKYYAETLGLGEQIYHEVGTYSKGMRQKLAIAMTLIHDPEMILLDEPASGLDPRYTKLLKDWIKNLSANGRTVLLSTHIIEMA